MLKDEGAETLARNRRKVAAVYCATQAGFEVIQGLLEHVMRDAGRRQGRWAGQDVGIDAKTCEDGAFFDGRARMLYTRARRSALWGGAPGGAYKLLAELSVLGTGNRLEVFL